MSSMVVGRALFRASACSAVSKSLRPQCSSSGVFKVLRQATPSRSFGGSRQLLVKKYTEDHEWIEVSEDGTTGTIGISEYAAKALGDVVYVELPTVDSEVSKGDSIGAIESVKSASDIMTPVSGRITEANSTLGDTPATVNKSPEGEGWFAKISITDEAELADLMDAAAYKTFTEEADSK